LTASAESSVIDENISSQLWYRTYSENWAIIKNKIDELQFTLYENILRNVAEFIYKSYTVSSMQKKTSVIPTAVILTGINQSDHLSQFQVLSKKIINNVSSHVVIMQARDCPTVKAAIEVMISNFVEEEQNRNNTIIDDDEDDGVDEKRNQKQFRKSQLTMSVLKTWYLAKYCEHPRQNLVVILPDFELFNAKVLQDLIMILR
jgi:origin recognition complex subunit 3